MLTIISYYFSSLVKHFSVLLFFCSFISLILFSLNYPLGIVFPIFIDILLLALPWGFWFHQILFCGLTTQKTGFTQLLFIIISTMLSTSLLLITFPYTQKEISLSLDKIRPNIIAPKGSIIVTPKGTLILDPLQNPQKMFAKPNSKALWIDSNYLIFSDLQTNKQSFELSQPESFSSFGYYPQSGSVTIPFYKPYSSLPQYKFGLYIVQTWFDTVHTLNNKIRELYISVDIPLPSITNKQLQQILTIKPPHTQSSNTSIFKNTEQDRLTQYKEASQQSKQELLKTEALSYIPKNIQTKIFDYLNIFLSVLSIFSVASFLGIMATLFQDFLAGLVILCLISLYAPALSIYIINISLKLYTLYPSFSILLINVSIIALLYLCSVIIAMIKNSIKGAVHQ